MKNHLLEDLKTLWLAAIGQNPGEEELKDLLVFFYEELVEGELPYYFEVVYGPSLSWSWEHHVCMAVSYGEVRKLDAIYTLREKLLQHGYKEIYFRHGLVGRTLDEDLSVLDGVC